MAKKTISTKMVVLLSFIINNFVLMVLLHLDGKGCTLCNKSHLEREIRLLLDKNNIKYEYRKKNFDWLSGLELDFYLPNYNIAIECQGEQHFIPKSFGGDKFKKFDKQIKLDELKALRLE